MPLGYQPICIKYYAIILPIKGLAEVMGMMLCTVFRNMVIDSSMVTPEKLKVHYYAMSDFQNIFILT